MAKKVNSFKRLIEQCKDKDKERLNNPLMGFVTANNNGYTNKNTYQFNFLIHTLKRIISLPFEAGKYNRIVIMLGAHGGIESLTIVEL